MEVGLVKRVDIDQEMQQAYLDYAMSVIVSRALPDARDGLKPVQRRILYAMHDMGLSPDSAFKKSARVVGEVLGKYHPHGDVAVYEAMARLAQDFTMRYELVDGQGNFGSIDGDPPAAMRYTEVRLTRYATELMAQIERNTVDFGDNFDGTLREPEVLPAAVPNLLVNGASGIAVGMATSIPPHNLAEVIDALSFMLENWEKLDDLGVEDLMRFVQGPDFPTGGIILHEEGDSGLLSAYGSGKGRITVRGRVHAEDMGRGRSRLIITELPYQTNKTSLIERIAELVRNGDLEGIADLRDESDRQGMRIVVELKQGAETEDTLRALYKHTPLQTTFGINLLALVDGEPRLLNLKQALRVFLEHRLVVVRRRSEFDLARAKHRQHILEGLRVALKHLDEIIALIRNSPDADQARARLMKRYDLTEIQAQAILDMQLRRLASLERKKIEDEYREVVAEIKDLEALLRSPRRMRQTVEQELAGMKEIYGDRRRTQIFSLKDGDSARSLLTTTDLTAAQSVWVGVTADGKIGRTHGETMPDALPRHLLRVSTHETLYLVNTTGQAAAVAVHTLPEVESFDGGAPLYKACALEMEDRLAFMFSLPPVRSEDEERYIMTVSRAGMLKKSSVSELPGPSAQRFVLVKVNAGDELVTGMLTDGKNVVWLVTAQGMSIRFSEEEVRPMGLVATGVMGIKLGEGDVVTAMLAWQEKSELALLASDGTGWRVASGEFPLQGRYGQGVIACRVARGAELIGGVAGNGKSSLLVYFQKGAVRRLRFGDFPPGRRGGKGAGVVAVKAGDEVIGLALADGMEARKTVKAPAGSSNSERSKDTPAKPRQTVDKPAKAATAGRKASAKAAEAPAAAAKPSARKPRAAGEPEPAQKPAAKRAAAKPASEPPAKKPAVKPKASVAAGARKKKTAAPPEETGAQPPVPGKARKTRAVPKEAPVAAGTGLKRSEAAAQAPQAAPKAKRKTSAAAPEASAPAPARKKSGAASSAVEQQVLPGLAEPKPKPKRSKAE